MVVVFGNVDVGERKTEVKNVHILFIPNFQNDVNGCEVLNVTIFSIIETH